MQRDIPQSFREDQKFSSLKTLNMQKIWSDNRNEFQTTDQWQGVTRLFFVSLFKESFTDSFIIRKFSFCNCIKGFVNFFVILNKIN